MSIEKKPDIDNLALTVPGVIYRLGLDANTGCHFVFISPKIQEVCGYSSDEILSGDIKWIDLLIEEDESILKRNIAQYPDQPLFSVEYRIRHKDGKIRWISDRGVIVWKDGAAKCCDGILLDISNTKATEVELLTRKKELSNLIASLDDVVFEIDSKGRFKNYYTKNWRKLMLPPASFLNKTISEAFASLPAHAALFEDAYHQTLEQNKSIEFEYSITDDKNVQWFRARFTGLAEPGSASVMITDITQQKEAELALQQSEQFLRWSSETAKIGGWEINLRKRTIHWSDEIYKIKEADKTGDLSLEEAIACYLPEVRATIEKILADGIEKGLAWDIELPLITANGNKKWVRDIGIPEMRNGKCIALRGVLHDITEMKNTELMLQKREQELDLAIKGADLGTWDWDIVTGSITINSQWTKMLGYNDDEIKSLDLSKEKLVHPDDKEFVELHLKDHLQGITEFYEVEYRLRHRNGNWIWVLDKGKVVERDAHDRPIRASGTYLDITGRKKVELQNHSLRLQLEEFKSAVSAATIVSYADLEGKIKYANKKFAEISQFDIKELIGSQHSIVNSGHHTRAFWKDMWKTIRAGKVWRAEVKNKRKDGTFYWVDTFIIPLKNTENQITEYLSIRNDITEKKENETKLQEALTKAEESDRLKSAFLANISHEIRTPMNAIMGFAELLERPSISEQKKQNFQKLIYERSQDLLGIVNDILDISKIEAKQVSIVPMAGNINELLHQLIRNFQEEAYHLRNKKIQVRLNNELKDDERMIRADFLKLKQVLYNLLTNAAKFTHEGTIDLNCRLKNNELLFSIKDTGIGIPADKFDSIFKPFRQATNAIHQQYGGSGLGLAICKGLVELWGGRIWVESELTKGSVFSFTIEYLPEINKEKTNQIPRKIS